MKKIIKLFVVLVIVIGVVCGCKKVDKQDKLSIVTTNFASYDFVRAIVKDNKNVEVKMLLKPGSDMHSYEPTPKDIISIEESDLFVYNGGESEEWVDDILGDIDTKNTKIVKMMDLVNLSEEEVIEGMESEEEEEESDEKEYDEHVWSSPANAIKIIRSLEGDIIKMDVTSSKLYEDSASEYISKLEEIDKNIKEVVSNSKRKTIVFGDRFPLRYFVDEYGLKYYAAFPGCSEQTEASSKTISYLIEKVKKEKIPVVFHIELSSDKISKTISKETGAKVKEFNAVHNISKDDFNDGVTYVDLMNKNIKVLKEALN